MVNPIVVSDAKRRASVGSKCRGPYAARGNRRRTRDRTDLLSRGDIPGAKRQIAHNYCDYRPICVGEGGAICAVTESVGGPPRRQIPKVRPREDTPAIFGYANGRI